MVQQMFPDGTRGKWKICVYRCMGANSRVFVLWPRSWPCPSVDPVTILIPEPYGKAYTPGMPDPPAEPFPRDRYAEAVLCDDFQ